MSPTSTVHAAPRPGASELGMFITQILGDRERYFTEVAAGESLAAKLRSAIVVPVTAFFLLTGADYYFLTLLHIVLVLGAGLVGMVTLHEGLEFACEQRGVHPKKAMLIMKVWAVLFAFVGIQMAWNLQPFVGDRGAPFQLFRKHEGNFYSAILYSLERLTQGKGTADPTSSEPDRGAEHVRNMIETMRPPAADSTGALSR